MLFYHRKLNVAQQKHRNNDYQYFLSLIYQRECLLTYLEFSGI